MFRPPLDRDSPYMLNETSAEPEDPKVRRRFVGWVFGLVALQLSIATGLIATCLCTRRLRQMVKKDKGAVQLVSLLIFIVALIILASRRVRRGPCGVMCLFVVTASMACKMASDSVQHSYWTVLLTACSTGIITLTIICFSTCIKAFDVTKYYAIMIVVDMFGLGCVFLLSLLNSVMPGNHLVELIIASIGSLLFAISLLDTIQMVLGGRLIVMRPDEVIFAAVVFYLDVVFIYWFLLMFKLK